MITSCIRLREESRILRSLLEEKWRSASRRSVGFYAVSIQRNLAGVRETLASDREGREFWGVTLMAVVGLAIHGIGRARWIGSVATAGRSTRVEASRYVTIELSFQGPHRGPRASTCFRPQSKSSRKFTGGRAAAGLYGRTCAELLVLAGVVWLYPAQLGQVGWPWRGLLPLLRLAAMFTLAISFLKPVAMRLASAAERGSIVVIVDRSKSMNVIDNARTNAQRVALADALAKLPPKKVRSDSATTLATEP